MAKKAIFGSIQFGDTPANVGEVRGFEIGREANEINTTVMNAGGNARNQPGAVNGTVSMTLFFENPEDAGQALLRNNVGSDTPQDITIAPFGVASGDINITGKMFVMNERVTAEAEGMVEIAYELNADENGLTYGTVV